ncbi:AAA family ATPase [Thiohalobacter sp. IOR34]|uniref:bifunctional aminoglycoside phosphotransferase/ATP-binding protein n=1 Tax=Thiohalobacter sp. IOR34 TaxID=3057176 RepID=UPI0025B0360C|nr:bifunctional aminoglycoside phosphotransferase/ATP-binding protein [Thiohalobacter sp. IOR34]WJW74419.1 AAA family ATPase [Thiohalobacter sp. IOR34]
MGKHSACHLAERLQSADRFPHAVERFELIETHISCLLLTGEIAYKIKKAVDLGFLDFSTLEKRHFYCQEELRLNRRLAPELYLEVVGIHGSEDDPSLLGDGEAVEYAVKMRQFPQAARLDRVTARGELQPTHIDRLARDIATFHQQLPVAGTDTVFGSAEVLQQQMRQNFEQIRRHCDLTTVIDACRHIQAWSEHSFSLHLEEFEQRRHEGWIRECHGDMHLANMVLLNERPLIFDCIEFSEELRWIDTMSEAAFLYMDLDYHDQNRLARRFLNQYLAWSSDYMGLSLLKYYLVYRAMVRAKVEAIQWQQNRDDPARAEPHRKALEGHLRLAVTYTRETAAPPIIILHGYSGAGKSRLAEQLAESCGAIHIRSDVERKHLLGLPPDADTRSELEQGAYTETRTRQTYQRLLALAYGIIDAGLPVIVDATFLKREQRAAFLRLATVAAAPFVILDVHARPETLRERIRRRAAEGRDPSEAGLEVLAHQLQGAEPLAEEEKDYVVEVDTDQPLEIETITRRILQTKHVPNRNALFSAH